MQLSFDRLAYTFIPKVAAMNYVLIPKSLGRCDDLRLRFMVRCKLINLLKFLPSRQCFPHGTRVRSSVNEEGQGKAAMVVNS